MKDDKINTVNAWLRKAENDLRTAEHVMTLNIMDNPISGIPTSPIRIRN
ncbi:MAG: hypothetical protein HY754_07335 [Nitrospirae bacterium]|nr:hypothetical protein [Nitrospirota bacterium]